MPDITAASAASAASPASRPAPGHPAVILAGGRSSRMGANKAMLPLGGRPLIAHVIARLLPQASAVAISARPGWAEDLGYPVIADEMPDQPGPLAGILAGLRHVQRHHPEASHMLSAPADSPFLPATLADQLAASLAGRDMIVIAASCDREHPVFGLWPVAIADDLEHWLANDENRRVRSFLARHPVQGVGFPMQTTVIGPLDPFFNINTPADLEQAELFLEALGG